MTTKTAAQSVARPEAAPMAGTARRAQWLGRVVTYGVLILAALFFLLPVYVLVVTSLKSYADVNLATMWNLPKGFSLDSFRSAWLGDPAKGVQGLAGNFFNSLKLAIPGTLLSTLLGSMNGYVLSKWKFRGADLIFPLILFGMFIPYQSVLIPLVSLLQVWTRLVAINWINAVQAWQVPGFLDWLPALVATSSLELGIDMGAIDLVIQVEAPPSVASGLQRIGRAGHQVGAPSTGKIFPKYRGDLLEAAVVVRRMLDGQIEETRIPRNPLDVLAQQVVAMGAMDQVRFGLKRRVPEDIGIVGFNDMSMACWPAYDLTTIRQPYESIVDNAIELVCNQIAQPGEIAQSRVFNCQLIVRGTLRQTAR